jgi:hypothetical protein
MLRGHALLTGVALLLTVLADGDKPAAADPQPDLEKYRRLPDEAKKILDKAERIEIFSLHPDRPEVKPKDDFHGWKVLGKTVVEDAKVRQEVVAALYKGIAESGGVAGCFRPRHGLRVTSGEQSVDLVICFECLWIQVHVGGKEVPVWTSFAAQPVLNRILRAANVPLAAKPGGD